MSTWMILKTPTGVHCWDLGDPTNDETAALVNAGQVLVGFPPTDAWLTDGSGFDAQVSTGQPHPSLLAQGHRGDVEDLRAVDPAAVAEHVAARAAAAMELAVTVAKDALAALPPNVLEAVLAHPDVATLVSIHKGG